MIRRRRLLIAAIHYIRKTIRPDSDRKWLAQFVALPRGEKLSITIKNLDSSILTIRDVDAALGVNRDAVGQVELAWPVALVASPLA